MTVTEFRQLGKNGPKLNPLGLGCMGMSDLYYGPVEDSESIKVLERALELGCTFWDTSDLYGSGHNERLLSQVLKKHRDQIFICTKFGAYANPETGGFGVSGKPEYVRKACEQSLERLGVDVIDLYYQHRVDPDTPIEETFKAMAELVKEGKVRYLGLSECSAATLRRAHKVHPIAAVQMEYSPWTLDIETNGILETARELGVAIIAYSPLGQGMLTGAITSLDDIAANDIRHLLPRYYPENFPKNLQLVEDIKALAAKKGVSPSEFVIAWVLHQGQDFFVIPGTKRIKYLEQNIKAGQLKLSDAEVAEMRELVAKAQPQGLRYPEPILAFCGH